MISLTHARLLVWTKAQNKIDSRIRILSDHGGFDVWVKEWHQSSVPWSNPSINKVWERESDECRLDSPSTVKSAEFVGESVETVRTRQLLHVDNLVVSGRQWADPSIEAVLMGHMSCPAGMIEDNWFDPIASMECNQEKDDVVGSGLNRGPETVVNAVLANGVPIKKGRGRPKKQACSLPAPLFVPSTPSKNSIEAHETWNTAKLLGITTSDEGAVIEELRKSKRIQALEENHSLGD
ncbi:unnamed protein product [Amaranthus hypochondriacus]